jgi:hypothetical protein
MFCKAYLRLLRFESVPSTNKNTTGCCETQKNKLLISHLEEGMWLVTDINTEDVTGMNEFVIMKTESALAGSVH